MTATPRPWLPTATAWLALLVLGFPGSLVVCRGPHCDRKIEVAHSADSCCESDAQHRAPGDTGETASEGHGCDDTVLGLLTGPLPERVSVDPDDRPAPQSTAAGSAESFRRDGSALLPPTTGPPRTDRRAALLASTVLLL